MANTYVAGDVVRMSATFTASGSNTDPSTIALSIRTPQNGLLQYTYAAGQITRDGTGLYHFDYTTTTSGLYSYRYVAGGTVVAAIEGSFLATSLGFV